MKVKTYSSFERARDMQSAQGASSARGAGGGGDYFTSPSLAGAMNEWPQGETKRGHGGGRGTSFSRTREM